MPILFRAFLKTCSFSIDRIVDKSILFQSSDVREVTVHRPHLLFKNHERSQTFFKRVAKPTEKQFLKTLNDSDAYFGYALHTGSIDPVKTILSLTVLLRNIRAVFCWVEEFTQSWKIFKEEIITFNIRNSSLRRNVIS